MSARLCQSRVLNVLHKVQISCYLHLILKAYFYCPNFIIEKTRSQRRNRWNVFKDRWAVRQRPLMVDSSVTRGFLSHQGLLSLQERLTARALCTCSFPRSLSPTSPQVCAAPGCPHLPVMLLKHKILPSPAVISAPDSVSLPASFFCITHRILLSF